MAKKRQKNKPRQIGKEIPVKKPLIPAKHKNAFWTIIIILTLLIFFIINNTREVPDEGPYPPGYNPSNLESDSLK